MVGRLLSETFTAFSRPFARSWTRAALRTPVPLISRGLRTSLDAGTYAIGRVCGAILLTRRGPRAACGRRR
ncbi:MAG TPA: hypothetical protein VIL08_03385, partial [Limnochorda sp.]